MQNNILTQSQDATNATNTVTLAAVAGARHEIFDWEVVISGAATGAVVTITIKSGATVKWKTFIKTAAPIGTRIGLAMTKSMPANAVNEAMTIVATTSGDASSVVTVNVSYETAPE